MFYNLKLHVTRNEHKTLEKYDALRVSVELKQQVLQFQNHFHGSSDEAVPAVIKLAITTGMIWEMKSFCELTHSTKLPQLPEALFIFGLKSSQDQIKFNLKSCVQNLRDGHLLK